MEKPKKVKEVPVEPETGEAAVTPSSGMYKDSFPTEISWNNDTHSPNI